MNLNRAGRLMSDVLVEARLRFTDTGAGVCAKCTERIFIRPHLQRMNELFDLMRVPSVFRGNYGTDSAGYRLSQLGKR